MWSFDHLKWIRYTESLDVTDWLLWLHYLQMNSLDVWWLSNIHIPNVCRGNTTEPLTAGGLGRMKSRLLTQGQPWWTNIKGCAPVTSVVVVIMPWSTEAWTCKEAWTCTDQESKLSDPWMNSQRCDLFIHRSLSSDNEVFNIDGTSIES